MNYQHITTAQQLADFCHPLHHQAWLAIDTEFVRQDTYYPLLSLVQICSQQGELAIIDPLTIDDMSPLWALLADKQVCKVFHSARQDIEVLFQVGGLMPQAIFDTQIACVFLGHGDMAGFARVIETELNVQIDKDQTRTNWHQRPLSDKQIAYALDDVRYLAPLYQKLQTQLTDEQKQALEWDFSQLLDASLYRIDPDQAWLKLKGTQHLSPKQLGIVKQLCAWRERTAIETNQPRKWVISDEAMIALAKRPARALEGLYKISEINAGQVRQYGDALIEQLDIAFQQPDSWPEKPAKSLPASTQEDIVLNLALAYAHQVALNNQLNLANLIQRRDVLALLRQQVSPIQHGWRWILIGRELQDLFSKNAPLKIIDGKLVLTS